MGNYFMLWVTIQSTWFYCLLCSILATVSTCSCLPYLFHIPLSFWMLLFFKHFFTFWHYYMLQAIFCTSSKISHSSKEPWFFLPENGFTSQDLDTYYTHCHWGNLCFWPSQKTAYKLYIYIYIYMCVCVCVYMCICIYVCVCEHISIIICLFFCVYINLNMNSYWYLQCQSFITWVILAFLPAHVYC